MIMSYGNDQDIPTFPGRVGIQQRVFPSYRRDFFECLGRACQGGLSLLAGLPGPGEGIIPGDSLEGAHYVKAGNLHFLRASSPFYICWQKGLIRWLEDWQPEVLIVEANSRTESSRLAVRWMHKHRRPVLGWGLGLAESRGGVIGSIRRWDQDTFLSSFDGLIAYSRQGAEQYHSFGFPLEKVFVAPNAVSRRPGEAMPECRVDIKRPVVLFVGRLQSRKRVDNLLRACASLPSDLQPRLLIVGDGPAHDELRNLAESVYPAAEFPGARQGDELEPFFTSADLFVLPGTGGLAIQQAMAHGLPVIVAEADGTQAELVRPGNGWIIPSNDLPALTQALKLALSDFGRLRQMGRESYRIVAEEMNLEMMVAAFVKALLSITQGSP